MARFPERVLVLVRTPGLGLDSRSLLAARRSLSACMARFWSVSSSRALVPLRCMSSELPPDWRPILPTELRAVDGRPDSTRAARPDRRISMARFPDDEPAPRPPGLIRAVGSCNSLPGGSGFVASVLTPPGGRLARPCGLKGSMPASGSQDSSHRTLPASASRRGSSGAQNPGRTPPSQEGAPTPRTAPDGSSTGPPTHEGGTRTESDEGRAMPLPTRPVTSASRRRGVRSADQPQTRTDAFAPRRSTGRFAIRRGLLASDASRSARPSPLDRPRTTSAWNVIPSCRSTWNRVPPCKITSLVAMSRSST